MYVKLSWRPEVDENWGPLQESSYLDDNISITYVNIQLNQKSNSDHGALGWVPM